MQVIVSACDRGSHVVRHAAWQGEMLSNMTACASMCKCTVCSHGSDTILVHLVLGPMAYLWTDFRAWQSTAIAHASITAVNITTGASPAPSPDACPPSTPKHHCSGSSSFATTSADLPTPLHRCLSDPVTSLPNTHPRKTATDPRQGCQRLACSKPARRALAKAARTPPCSDCALPPRRTSRCHVRPDLFWDS